MQEISVRVLEDAKKLNDALKRLYISHKTFKSYYYKDKIRVNGKRVMAIDPVKKGDIITFFVEGSVSPVGLKTDKAKVLYEDDLIFLMEKPPKILTHESRNHFGVNFKDMATAVFNEKNIYEPVRFINRLDMDTSGIIMIAKSDIAQGFYQKLHENEKIIKEYILIARGGEPLNNKITVKEKIGRDDLGIKRKIAKDDEAGLFAKTIFTPLYYKDGFEIMKARILTGRTHQIRVHLSHLNKVLVGDELYGDDHSLIDRHALHSFRLRTMGINGEIIDIISPLPKDMVELIRRINNGI